MFLRVLSIRSTQTYVFLRVFADGRAKAADPTESNSLVGRAAFSSALATPNQAQTAYLSTLAAPNQTQAARAAFLSALAAPGQGRTAILSALAFSSALPAPWAGQSSHFERPGGAGRAGMAKHGKSTAKAPERPFAREPLYRYIHV